MVGDDVLEAVARLSTDADFAVFLDELRKRREAARTAMEKSTELVLMGRAQGVSAFIGELLELAQGARMAIAKRRGR